MKKILFISSLALISMRSMSQNGSSISVNAGPDKCASPSSTLTASATVTTYPATIAYQVATRTYNLESLDGTSLFANPGSRLDDTWLANVNLGFSFSYYGNTYTQVCVGVNGRVTFDLGRVTTYDSWIIDSYLPGVVSTASPVPNNTICAVFRDIDPRQGGNIYTKTIGTAPCRKFVVSWVNIPLYNASSCSPGVGGQTFQLVLNESTNTIDVNVQQSQICTQWNNGKAIIGIQGVQNGAMSPSTSPAGRSGVWAATNESWRFSPSGATSQIPYTGVYTWTGPSGVIGTGASINVSPTACTNYTVTASSYSNCSGANNNSDQVSVCPRPNPDFSLTSYRASASDPFFTMTAVAMANPANYQNLGFYWEVVEVNVSDNSPVANTAVYSPECWWYAPV